MVPMVVERSGPILNRYLLGCVLTPAAVLKFKSDTDHPELATDPTTKKTQF